MLMSKLGDRNWSLSGEESADHLDLRDLFSKTRSKTIAKAWETVETLPQAQTRA